MNDHARAALEVRVHGIGDKDALSSLGPPRVLASVDDDRADVVAPPSVPGHPLVLVNWSRWNRTGWAVGWFLSWPFTLLNAVGEMRPRAGIASRVHAFLAHSLAVVATAVSFVWVAAAFEVFSRVMPTADSMAAHSGSLAVIAAGALLISVLVFRAFRGGRPPAPVTAGHAVVVLCTCIAVLVVRPSQQSIEIQNALFRGLTVDSYTTADLDRIPETYAAQGATDIVLMTQYVDPLAWVGYLSLAMVALLMLVGLSAERAPSTQCAIVAGAIAIALINLYGAILLALAKAAVSALTGLSLLQRFLPGEQRLDDAVLIGRTGEGLSTDMLPLVAIATVLVIALTVTMIAARFPLATLRSPHRRESLNRWAHKALPAIGSRLPNAMWIAAVTVILLIEFLGLGVGVLVNRWGGYEIINNVQVFTPGRPATLLLTVSGLILTACLFALRSASLRRRLTQALAFAGDVIGFWPVRTHPFAAQSYRTAATAAIDKALPKSASTPTVLVGHSQGSVLAAWYVANAPAQNLALLTCGSPLDSLYAQFFPSHFDPTFSQKVLGNTRYWLNVWRETDPIGTSIPAADSNRQSTDPVPGEVPRCHSHYWTDEEQEGAVREALGLHGGPPISRGATVTPEAPT